MHQIDPFGGSKYLVRYVGTGSDDCLRIGREPDLGAVDALVVVVAKAIS